MTRLIYRCRQCAAIIKTKEKMGPEMILTEALLANSNALNSFHECENFQTLDGYHSTFGITDLIGADNTKEKER